MKLINGWTIASVMKQIKARNNGTRCFKPGITPDKNVCQYRHKDNACYAGAFIPDDVYTPSIEGRGIGVLLSADKKIKKEFFPFDRYGMEKLQKFHDCYMGNDLHGDTLKFLKNNATKD